MSPSAEHHQPALGAKTICQLAKEKQELSNLLSMERKKTAHLTRIMGMWIILTFSALILVTWNYFKYQNSKDDFINRQREAVWNCHDNFMLRGWENAAEEVLYLMPAKEQK